ncbi:unnamed protein product [Rhizophagus irregularis]|nr:unnamed protein product [Rhizophagus irregularis]
MSKSRMVRNPEILARIKHNAARFGIFGILTFRILYQTRHKALPISTILTINANTNAHFMVSDKNRAINAPEVYFRCTPPPDDASNTTMSVSYFSAAESVDTIIYPLTPAHA